MAQRDSIGRGKPPDISTDTGGETQPHYRELGERLASDYDKANLGCGDDLREAWLNVDIRGRDIDMAWDLDDQPWPFPDDSFRIVAMHNVLEHLDDHLDVLTELKRITKPGGEIRISGPHWNSPGAWIDPTHTRPFHRGMFKHALVRGLFEVEDISATRVRWGRLLPERVALALADHISHGVSEIQVTLRVPRDVRDSRELDCNHTLKL